MSSGTTVEFFFDCSSQWTKLAFHNIRAISRDLGFKIEWKPILLGAVAEVAAAVGAYSGAVRPATDLGHRVLKVADCDARQPSRSDFDHQQTSVCKRDRAFGKAKPRCDFLRWLVSLYLFTYFKPFLVGFCRIGGRTACSFMLSFFYVGYETRCWLPRECASQSTSF